MPRPAKASAAQSNALLNAPTVNAPAANSGNLLVDVGQAGNRDTLAVLEQAVRELKALAVAPILKRSIDALNREDFEKGGELALQALERDERNGVGWYLLGISRERAGDFPNSVRAYEAALKLLPDHAEVANDLGRLAYRMGMHEQAEKLFRRFMAHAPEKPDGANNLASVLKDSGRRDEAIELLRETIPLHPERAMLWNTLGTLMLDIGDLPNAVTFLSEAIRLEPKFAKARYNLGQAKVGMGDPAGALADCDAAMKLNMTADDRANMKFARATFLLALGRLAEGWEEYEERLSPQFPGLTRFLIDAPMWKPGVDFGDKRFLVVAEQGLGDELLFANLLPDVIARMRPGGRIMLAVERRLVTLFERSFPEVEVVPHATYVLATQPARIIPGLDESQVDLWTPMGSLLRECRRDHADFPDHKGYMRADPERVAHWKRLLEAMPGRKVGLLWKSAITRDHRSRYFSPFHMWEPVLRTPGVTFVNLQYGDCTPEVAHAKAEFGVDIWQPPEIDLKQDLDDVAALCLAMDLVIGFSNATFNIAAACGAPSWLITPPATWPRLGSPDRYPWYPRADVFSPAEAGDWPEVMVRIGERLAAGVAER